mmetsp:Transcript_21115/g.52353  ORF Transcript_21115/g.52353 Transcript_21115/m.52353 type:complete len:97 (+) Transcript_21115:350-640(+)
MEGWIWQKIQESDPQPPQNNEKGRKPEDSERKLNDFVACCLCYYCKSLQKKHDFYRWQPLEGVSFELFCAASMAKLCLARCSSVLYYFPIENFNHK